MLQVREARPAPQREERRPAPAEVSIMQKLTIVQTTSDSARRPTPHPETRRLLQALA